MTDDEKLIKMYIMLYGEPGKRFSLEVEYQDEYDEDGYHPYPHVWVNKLKDWVVVSKTTREDIMCEYITRDFDDKIEEK